jgi:adenosylmethionine-8-amino-7-oxononanoate aminotransferase
VSSLVARDRAHVWHPYASVTTESPLYEVVGARGCRLTLADGRELVDGMSSWWAAIHGYGHPVLDTAVHDQVERFAHVMFGGLTHQPAVELAELLVEITPPALTKVFFADSGSVAVEVAIKMALQYWQGRGAPQRRLLLTVRGGYHGDTAGAMSVCDPVTGMHRLFGDYVAKQLFVDRPRPAYGEVVDPSELDQVRAVLAEHGEEIACLVIEPIVQGAGGMWFYAADYLRQLVEMCREYGLLVLFDEIATGFGRTGLLFAADHAGVTPDIMCVGKALTGGYLSLGATLCTQQVADGVCAPPGNALMHGPTFMANPLACAVALASTRLLLAEPWQKRVDAISTALREQLEPCRDVAGVADVRVLGAIGVVELDQPVDMAVIQPALIDRGVWLRPFGKLIYTMPPYICDLEDVRAITAAVNGVVTGLGAGTLNVQNS